MVCSVVRFDASFGTVFLMYKYVPIIQGSIRKAEWPPFGKQLLPHLTVCSLCISSTLRERLRTHKVFTKDQLFYLNYR